MKKKIDNADNITILKRQYVCSNARSLPNLLPSWIPLSCYLRRVTTTRSTRRQGRHPPGRRTSAAAAIAGKCQTPGAGRCDCLSRRLHGTHVVRYLVVHCGVRTQPSYGCGIVFRAPAHARGGRR